MTISINNPIQSTNIIIGVLLVIFLLFNKKDNETSLTLKKTHELKGFAIGTVLFAHIGYFLSNQHDFLFPLSILAGVGVNLFLFLSGYGLTVRNILKKETVFEFYKKRILKLLIPFWIVLLFYLVADCLFLHIVYSKKIIVQSFFGIFPHANIFTDLNSPLWYMTLIIFYYIVFPLIFIRKKPWVSALILCVLSFIIIRMQPEFLNSVLGLYKVHMYAFPIGVLIASIFQNNFYQKYSRLILKYTSKISIQYIIYFILLSLIGYFAIHSGVGESVLKEQFISIVTMFFILSLFLFKRVQFTILTILGVYSYEIYLLHWPLMYRYDFLYKNLPSSIATILYIPLLIGLGWVLKKTSSKIGYILDI